MLSVRYFALDSLLIICLSVIVVVSLSVPCSRLIDAFLDHYYPSPPPRAASAIPAENGWRLDRESEHFTYYTQPDQRIPDWAVELNEITYAKMAGLLPVTRVTRVKYYKYRSQADLQPVFGRPRKGYADQTDEGGAVHSVYSCHPHEVIHVLTYPLGRPPALFEEGIAVAYDWRFTVEKGEVYALAQGKLLRQELFPLPSILATRDFQAHDSTTAYVVAGSFVKYLMDTYGPDKMRSLFTVPRYGDVQEIEVAFQEIYGQSISEMESEWWAFLRAWRPPESPSWEEKRSLLLFGGSSLILLLLGGIAFSSLVDRVFAVPISYLARCRGKQWILLPEYKKCWPASDRLACHISII